MDMGGGLMGGGMFIIFSFIIFFPVNCIIECLGPGWLYNIMCFFYVFSHVLCRLFLGYVRLSKGYGVHRRVGATRMSQK